MMLLLIYVSAGCVLVWLLVRWAEPRLAFFPTRGSAGKSASCGTSFRPAGVVMYGRPPLGKEDLAALAGGLEQSCIRPVGAVG